MEGKPLTQTRGIMWSHFPFKLGWAIHSHKYTLSTYLSFLHTLVLIPAIMFFSVISLHVVSGLPPGFNFNSPIILFHRNLHQSSINTLRLQLFSTLSSLLCPFSVLTQVWRFPYNLSHPSISFIRLLSKRPYFRSSSKTFLHVFLGLPFPAFSGTTVFLQADPSLRHLFSPSHQTIPVYSF